MIWIIKLRSEEVFICDKCEFETKSEKGLNIHKKRKPPIITVCKICEKQFDSQKNLKMHIYTHSYQSKGDISQTCKKSNFECGTIESMEVHLGKCNVEEFECGLCETNLKLKNTENHS